jgi:hypothetical protein
MALHRQAQQIAPHVAYELKMLYHCLRKLATWTMPSEDGNMAMEAFLLHARNLYDFFFAGMGVGGKDVSVEHFLDAGSEWNPVNSTLSPYLTAQRQRLNRSIQHLSYDRIGFEPYKDWDLSKIYDELRGLWQQMMARLPAARQAWFEPPTAAPTGKPYTAPALTGKTTPITNVRSG